MKCPSCQSELVRIKDGDFELDACENGCGGVWFDRDELLKFDEEHEFSTSPILTLAAKKVAVKVDSTKLKNCPHCPGEVLIRQFLDNKNEIEMDQCWKCSGVWLDLGEINTLRAQYKTMADRSAAVNKYVDQIIDSTKKSMEMNTQHQIAAYNEETSNCFKSALFAFKKLLGVDDPYDGL